MEKLKWSTGVSCGKKEKKKKNKKQKKKTHTHIPAVS
jgi:hypothetical protein